MKKLTPFFAIVLSFALALASGVASARDAGPTPTPPSIAVATAPSIAPTVTAPKLDSFSADVHRVNTQVVTSTPTSPSWTGEIFLGRHDTYIVVGHDVTASYAPFGLRNITIHFEAVGGYGYHHGTVVAGGDGSIRFAISTNDTLGLGLGYIYDADAKRFEGVLAFSLSHRF